MRAARKVSGLLCCKLGLPLVTFRRNIARQALVRAETILLEEKSSLPRLK